MKLTIHAPAKVNWFLEITGRRPDGFHEVVTVMQAVSLYDTITVEDRPAPGTALRCNVDLGRLEDNLVYRAAELLRTRHAPNRGAQIALTKQIPHGAGLGGGSSDASNTLVALNRLWGLNLGNEALRALAAELGSDCAFFVEGGVALCTGRGEQVKQWPDVTGFDLVLLYPEAVCPTKDVYADLRVHLTAFVKDCYLVHGYEGVGDRRQLASLVTNRLQESALRVSNGMRAAWLQTSAESGVLVRFVSGSGSTIAFLMESDDAAAALARSLQSRGLGRAFPVKTVGKGARWG